MAATGERDGEGASDARRRAGDEGSGHLELQRGRDRVDGGVDRVADPHLADRALRVLEPVAGDGAHDDVVGRRPGRRRPPGAARRPTRPTPARRSTPSSAASRRYASRISASVTAPMWPPDSSRAAIAPSHDAGLPIWIAVAIVSGCSTGSPRTIGAAPAACQPSMRGGRVARPSAWYSHVARQYAVMFPALPTGMQCTSGASPSASTISNAAVFCPSMRNGLTELTTSTPGRSPSSRTIASASSKLPRTGTTRRRG